MELLGVDCFVSIKYYIKYQESLAPFRVFMIQILIWGLALLNSVLILLNVLNQTGIFRFHMFVALCYISLIILVTVLQIETMSSMKTLLVLTESSLD